MEPQAGGVFGGKKSAALKAASRIFKTRSDAGDLLLYVPDPGAFELVELMSRLRRTYTILKFCSYPDVGRKPRACPDVPTSGCKKF